MSNHPNTNPTSDEPPKKAGLKNRFLSVLGKILLGTLVCLILVLIMGRVYFSDDRIKSLATQKLSEAIHTDVEIRSLDINLLEGIQIDGVTIHAPKSFSKPPLAFEKFIIEWDIVALLDLHIKLAKVILVKPSLNFEENASGTNIEALLRSRLPPPTSSPSAATPNNKTEKTPLQIKQPHLPLQITLQNLEIQNASLAAYLPDMQAVLPNLSLQSSFEGEGTQLELKNRVTLGNKENHTEITLKRGGNDAIIATSLSASLHSNGLDKTSFEFVLDSNAATTLASTGKLPSIPINGKINVEIGLLPPQIQVPTFEWSIGSKTNLQVQAKVNSLFEDPNLALQQFKANARLQDFASLIPFFVPKLSAGGEISLSSAPVELQLSDLKSPHALAIKAPFHAKDINISFDGNLIKDAQVQGEFAGTGKEFQIATTFEIGSLNAQGNQAHRISGSINAKTPSAPWFEPEYRTPNDKIKSNIKVIIEKLLTPSGKVRNNQIEINAECPIALLHDEKNVPPLKVQTKISTDKIATGQASIKALQLNVDTSAHDLKGDHVEVDIVLKTQGARARIGKDSIRMRQINSNLTINKQGQKLDIDHGRILIPQLGTLSFDLALARILSPRPLIKAATIQTSSIDLKKSLNLLPPSLRPELEVAGKASFSATTRGRLDPIGLSIKAAPPLVNEKSSQENWETSVNEYVQFITEWVELIENKLPFHSKLEAQLKKASFKTPDATVQDFNGRFAISLPQRAPKLEFEFSAGALLIEPTTAELAPTSIKDFGANLSLALEGDTLITQAKAFYGYLSKPSLPRPLKDGVTRLQSAYRFGGDLLLENIQFDSQGINLGFKADGVWVDPLGTIIKRDWLGDDLDNFDLKFNWALRTTLSPALVLKKPKATITGNMVMAGEANLDDSLLSLEATTSFDRFNIQKEEQTIENLSGTLPFRAEISIVPITDGVLVARDIPIGSGRAWLKTESQDIRDDSAAAIFQERLKAYQPSSGIHIDRITSGKHEIRDFKFQGQLDKGILKSNEISMHILGGDIVGEAGFQLTHQQDFAGTFRFQASNMDASYFGALDLLPGPQSELSADFSAQFLFGPQIRNLEADMNVTKIGPDTLDRFLQLLDPEKTNLAIQDYRKYLPLITIDEVAVWIRHENMNMDLLYTTLLRIPGTQIGFRPIDREMIRRFSLSELVIDPYMQKQVDHYVGPFLGWK